MFNFVEPRYGAVYALRDGRSVLLEIVLRTAEEPIGAPAEYRYQRF